MTIQQGFRKSLNSEWGIRKRIKCTDDIYRGTLANLSRSWQHGITISIEIDKENKSQLVAWKSSAGAYHRQGVQGDYCHYYEGDYRTNLNYGNGQNWSHILILLLGSYNLEAKPSDFLYPWNLPRSSTEYLLIAGIGSAFAATAILILLRAENFKRDPNSSFD